MADMDGLNIDEAALLAKLSESPRGKALAGLGVSDEILDSLLDKNLVTLKNGILEITPSGSAETFCKNTLFGVASNDRGEIVTKPVSWNAALVAGERSHASLG